MSIEVYLLSIPFARHRSIVPRHRRGAVLPPGREACQPHPRLRGVAQTIAESSPYRDTLQRTDPG